MIRPLPNARAGDAPFFAKNAQAAVRAMQSCVERGDVAGLQMVMVEANHWRQKLFAAVDGREGLPD